MVKIGAATILIFVVFADVVMMIRCEQGWPFASLLERHESSDNNTECLFLAERVEHLWYLRMRLCSSRLRLLKTLGHAKEALNLSTCRVPSPRRCYNASSGGACTLSLFPAGCTVNINHPISPIDSHCPECRCHALAGDEVGLKVAST